MSRTQHPSNTKKNKPFISLQIQRYKALSDSLKVEHQFQWVSLLWHFKRLSSLFIRVYSHQIHRKKVCIKHLSFYIFSCQSLFWFYISCLETDLCCKAMGLCYRMHTNVKCYCFLFLRIFIALVVILFDTFKYHYAHIESLDITVGSKGKWIKYILQLNKKIILYVRRALSFLSNHSSHGVKWIAVFIHSRFQWNRYSGFALKCKYFYLPCLNWLPHSAFISNAVFFWFKYDSLRSKKEIFFLHFCSILECGIISIFANLSVEIDFNFHTKS